MESSILVEKNHPVSHSNLVSKVESSIRIDSITIDLDSIDKKVEAEKCSHFSIRGYVSEIRKQDWKMCWPFVSDGDSNKYQEQACLLPPLHVPKFRFWRCHNCVCEVGAKGVVDHYGTAVKPCSNGFKSTNNLFHATTLDHAAMLSSEAQEVANRDIPEGRQTNANASDILNNTTECHHSLCIDKNEKKSKDTKDPIIGENMGSESYLNLENHKLACIATEVISSSIQKTDHTDEIVGTGQHKQGHGHREVGDAEAGKVENGVKNSNKICEAGKGASMDDQHKELIAHGASGEGGHIDNEALTAEKDPVSHPSIELDEYDDPSSESAELMVGNESQDVHDENSSGLPRRKTRKVRLLTELLCENGVGEADNVRTQSSLPNAIPDASAGIEKSPVLHEEVIIQGKARRGLGQNRKRKMPQDEGSRPMEMSSPNKVSKEDRIIRRDEDAAEPFVGTESEEDASARMSSQTGMKIQWAKNKSDRSLTVSTKKNKKALNFDEGLSLEPSRENMPIEIGENIGENPKANPLDDVLTKSSHNAFTGREMDLFPSPPPRMEKDASVCKKKGKMPQVHDFQVPPTPWNHGILREVPTIRKDVGPMYTGPVAVPFCSSQDASLEKGLDLSLNSYKTAQSYDGRYIPQIENRQSSLFTWQVGASENQVPRKAAETKHVRNFSFTSKIGQDAPFEKGVHSDLSTKRLTFKMPFLKEKQKYSSQVEIAGCSLVQNKEFCTAKSKQKAVGIHEHSTFSRKDINQRPDKMSEQGGLDDIPMEIVELMARNQYERCLPDGEYEKHQLETTDNTRRSQTMNFSEVYGFGGLSLFQREATQKQNPPPRRNGIIRIEEMAGPSKQKAIDFFSQADRNHFSMSQLERTSSPLGFGAFLQHQQKPPCRVQHSASSCNIQNIAHNSKQIGDVMSKRSCYTSFQSPGPCNTCQSSPPQCKEANHLWSSMMSNRMPFVYSIPPKCATPSTTVDVFPHSPGSMLKENINGGRDLKFPNKNATNLGKQDRNFGPETVIRARAEYPFSGKHNEIELNQKPMGSLDLYSNETIPAMHLLSLMDAGVQSSAPISMDANRKFLKRSSTPHNPELKEFSRLDASALKAINTAKHPPYNYHSKSQLAENSHDHIPTIQTKVGASSSSAQNDKRIRKTADFPSLVHQDKQKRKDSDSRTQNKVNKSQKSAYASFGTNCGSVSVHSMQAMFFGAPDSSAFAFPFHALENPYKHKLESYNTNKAVHPRKSSSEAEICSLNRNPADFSVPEAGNVYMIAGEDLKFEKETALMNGYRPVKLDGHRRQRRLPAMKDHGRPPMP